jgi:hypothetical protein
MLNLHSIEAPPADISARAVHTLVAALDAPDRSAAVAAAIALLAVAHQLPVQLLAVEAAGVSVEVLPQARPRNRTAAQARLPHGTRLSRRSRLTHALAIFPTPKMVVARAMALKSQ